MKLYHLSDKNHDNETFIPRQLPKWRAMEGENWRAKRICVSTSIDGALTALLSSDSEPFGKHLFVHVPEDTALLESKNKIFTPSRDKLPDVEVTGEALPQAASDIVIKTANPIDNTFFIRFPPFSHCCVP